MPSPACTAGGAARTRAVATASRLGRMGFLGSSGAKACSLASARHGACTPHRYNWRLSRSQGDPRMTQTTMKALVKREAGKGIWMQEVPLPSPGPNEVLVRLEKTAICGTDLHIYLWDEWSQRTITPGLVIGHEFVGRIARLGSAVAGYEVGQRVSAEGHIVCGHCRNCRAGRQHLCPNTVGIGVNRDGAFAEYIGLPATNRWPIPEIGRAAW